MVEDHIYSSVPEEQFILSGDHQRLVAHLKSHKGQFFKARKLAEACGFRTTGTQVELRKAITELIELGGHPIVSTSKGFSWAYHPNMLRHYEESLQFRLKGLQRRINAVNKIFHKMLDDNPEFKKDIRDATRDRDETG
jgi:hypothetical protein